MIVKYHDITDEILLEVLQLSIATGQRIYVEDNNIKPSQEWIDMHMKTGTHWSNIIRKKLNINQKVIISIDYEKGKIIETDELILDSNYNNNYRD